MSLSDRLRSLRLDLRPWRSSPDFRRLWSAGTIYYLGGMIGYVAMPYQIYQLTGSNLAVGLMGLVELAPLLVFGLWGGALADHVDRRRLLIACGLAQAVLVALLAANAMQDDPQVWAVYVLGFLLTIPQSLQRPSKEALLPRTVTHDEIMAANALDSFGMQTGVLVGPAVGGLLIANAGTSWCYVVHVAGLLFATALISRMGSYPHRDETTPPSLRSIAEGIRYATSRRDLLGTYLVDIAAMMLAMPVVLFPALAEKIYERPDLLGLLYSAETVGALLATATSGWAKRVHHHGKAIVVAAACYGLAVAAAGLAPTIWLTMVGLALAGAADMVSALFRGTVWNQTIPETMRGRLAGIEMLSYSVGPLAGQVRAGITADRWTVRGAITSGGLACVVGVGLVALVLRDFWRYDARTDEHAVAERARREQLAAAD